MLWHDAACRGAKEDEKNPRVPNHGSEAVRLHELHGFFRPRRSKEGRKGGVVEGRKEENNVPARTTTGRGQLPELVHVLEASGRLSFAEKGVDPLALANHPKGCVPQLA